MGTFLQDLRFGVRLLIRNPGYTAIAVISLALGIGVNTMTFSGINSVLLKPIPVADPARIVSVYTTDERNPGPLPMSTPNARDYGEKNEVFSGLTWMMGAPLSLSDTGGEPEIVPSQLVTGNFFDVLGVKPALGRTFLPEEDRTPGTHFVVVLSDDAWQQRFGGDRGIIGRTVILNRQAFTVIGVAPRGFRGTNPMGRPFGWIPSMTYRQVLNGFALQNFEARRALLCRVIGRLRPGTSLDQARANLATIAKQLELAYPTDNKGRSVRLVTLPDDRLGPQGGNNVVVATTMLMAIVGLVLLIACANVANLLLARATTRRREIALRLALGATRARIVRQLLIESLTLATLGGLLAVPLAYLGGRLLLALRPPFFPADAIDVVPDGRVLLFTAVATVFTGFAFGLVPALRASRPDLVVEIKEGTGGEPGRDRLFGVRNLLVMGQTALSLVALITAGLFVRSLGQALQIDPGFDSDRLASLSMNLGTSGYDEVRGREFQRQMIERAGAVPGVEGVTLADWAPLVGGGFLRTVYLEGQDTSDPRKGRLVQIQNISPDYFKTMGIRLVRGRVFQGSDLPEAPLVVIVNETMAERFWPGTDPVGKRFSFHGLPALLEVVGIAKDSAYNAVPEEKQPLIYAPLTQNYTANVTLILRASNPGAVLGTVRGAVQQLDPRLPIRFVMTTAEAFRQSLFVQRFGAGLLAFFGALAFGLALVGIYGVTSYAVTRRTREIGIRMALGATRNTIVGEVLKQGALLAGIGAAVGVVVALMAARAVGGLLYGVGAGDPLTFVAIPAALLLASVAASYLPARRAATIEPLMALRHE